jgi:hypothetical protein
MVYPVLMARKFIFTMKKRNILSQAEFGASYNLMDDDNKYGKDGR